VKELCRKHGFSDARRLKALEAENSRLKKLLPESMFENEVTREALRKNGDRAGASGAGAVDADQGTHGTTLLADRRHERQCAALSAPSRPQCAPAVSYRRSGAASSTLRGWNEIWSMDFVHEAVALVAEHPIGSEHLRRIMDSVCSQRGKPAMIRTDHGPEFTGRAMLTWAHRHGIALRLIEPGKPIQNAYVESFNGRLRDEWLTEHWFTSLAHAPSGPPRLHHE
jgi:transposase InsO family protein